MTTSLYQSLGTEVDLRDRFTRQKGLLRIAPIVQHPTPQLHTIQCPGLGHRAQLPSLPSFNFLTEEAVLRIEGPPISALDSRNHYRLY